jgi:hypothetical protein
MPVTLSLVSGPATLQGNTVTLDGTAGTVTIRAEQPGNADYYPAPIVERSFEVLKLAQNIDFQAIADKSANDLPFSLMATASSGLPVLFTIVSGPASLAGGTVALDGTAGTVTVRASQPGNGEFQPAPNVEQSFEVLALDQTIDFPAIPDKLTNDLPFDIMATSSSGLPVGFAVVAGPASVVGNTITLTGTPGTVTMRASQPGNGTYLAAPNVEQDFVVTLFDATDEASGKTPFMAVYPNPAGRWLHVRFSEHLAGPYDLSIHNSLGQLVAKTAFAQGQATVPLDIGTLPDGVYLLICSLGSSKAAVRFVKNGR